tara:strand:+ start:696 stop:827 length:132 start_codon:yes stop_codon:yes gene_type:complete
MIQINEIIEIAQKVCEENDLNIIIDETSSFVAGNSSLDSMCLI